MNSISKILRETKPARDLAALESWVKKVGEEQAEAIRKEAVDRGNLFDKYLEDIDKKGSCDNQYINEYFKDVEILNREQRVQSISNRFYGRYDLVLKLGNMIALTDLKNSLKPKRERYIKDYYLQVAGYIIAYNEQNPENQIDKGLIIIWTKEPESIQRFYLVGSFLEECKLEFLSRVKQFYKNEKI